MKIKFYLILLLSASGLGCFAQDYYHFMYTNVPESKAAEYSQAANNATGWLYSGKYISSEICNNCNSLSDDSKTKREMLDSLSRLYKELYYSNSSGKKHVPGGTYYVTDDNQKRYILTTLCEIKNNSFVGLFQVKIVFSESIHNDLHDIFEIQIAPGTALKKFDSKLILADYKQTLKEERKLPPPAVEKNKN